jgi:hypothetical protein
VTNQSNRKAVTEMKFENQNNYSGVPYPSPTLPNATVASGGCGVCCAVNVLRYFGVTVAVKDMAKIFIDKKIRVNGGTSMTAAVAYLRDEYGLTVTLTKNVDEVQKAITGGAVGIMSVSGNRTGYTGIFSTGAHFVNIVSYDGIPPKPFIVFDVGHYANKYTSAYRKQFVSVAKDEYGNTIQFTTAAALKSDGVNFWLFTKPKPPAPQMTGAQAVDLLYAKGIITSPDHWKNVLAKIERKEPITREDVRYIGDIIVKCASAL